MIAFAWRQHRIQLTAGIGVLALLAAVLAWTGQEMTSYLHSSGLAACLSANAGCDTASGLFESRFGGLLRNLGYLNFLPMLIGVFWGCPLVAREIETGTHLLAWTQSVTRRRWLLTKIAFFVGATVVLGVAFALLLTWWLRPFALLSFGNGFARMDLNSFDFQGIVPIGYSLFAFAVGLTAGALLRRVLPAMAATFAVYLTVRLWVQSLRTHYQPPLRLTYQALSTSPRSGKGDWVITSNVENSSGHPVNAQMVQGICRMGPGARKSDVTGCLTRHGFHQLDLYQPATRFWTFQVIEFAIFAGLAVLLIATAVYWVTHHTIA